MDYFAKIILDKFLYHDLLQILSVYDMCIFEFLNFPYNYLSTIESLDLWVKSANWV